MADYDRPPGIALSTLHPITDAAVAAMFSDAAASVGAQGGYNAFIGKVLNDAAVNTTAFPAGITGYGQSKTAGNQAFGLFGRADLYSTGVATNEVNSFNQSGIAPSGTFPPDRSIGTADHLAIALTVAAGGGSPSAIGVHVCREGQSPQSFLAGIYSSPDACTSYGQFIDATAAVGPATGLFINMKDSGVGIDLRALGVNAVPLNIRAASGQSAALLRVQANGGAAIAAIGAQGQFRPGNGTAIGGGIWGGSGAPAFSATAGDYYFRTDTPGTVNQRLYVCTGGASWTGIL